MTSLPRSRDRASWHIGLGLVAVGVVIAYLPALGAFFVKDDLALLSSARLEVPEAFGHSWPGGFFRPVAELLFGGQYALFGLHPLPYHLVSLAVHTLATILVYKIFKLFTEHPQKSLAVAGVFALHPLNTESVSWIGGQMSLFSGAGGLLVLYLLLRQPPLAVPLRIFLILGVFLASLGCYENQVVVPLMWAMICMVYSRLRPVPHAHGILFALLFVGSIGTFLYWRSAILDLGGGYYEVSISIKSGVTNLFYYLYLLCGGSAVGGRILNYRPGEIWSGAAFEVFTPLFMLALLLFAGAGAYLAAGRFGSSGRQGPNSDILRHVLLAGGWTIIALAPALILNERPRRLGYLAAPGFALLGVETLCWLKQKTCPSPLGARAGLIGGILLLVATLHLRNQDWRQAGALEEGLPAAVQPLACSHLAFDVPDLLGDALFFNSAAVAFWLERQTGKGGWRVYTPHELPAAGTLPANTCYFRYHQGQIHALAATPTSSFPTYLKGQNWVVSGD